MRGLRITPIEVLVVLICIGLLSVLVLPALLISREESRSSTCQSHQVKLILVLRDLRDPVEIADPSQWPARLSIAFPNPSTIEHCPSDERQPPALASYGINSLVTYLSEHDLDKIVFLDYDAITVLLTGDDVATQWTEAVAPRHFESVNLAFYDTHIELREPRPIAPVNPENKRHFWLPQVRNAPADSADSAK